MTGIGDNSTAPGQLRSLVDRIEVLETEISNLNGDKSEVYKEAKSHGFDPKVMRKVVAARRKDPAQRQEEDAVFDLYMDALNGSEGVVRAHVETIEEFPPHNPETGEIEPEEITSPDENPAPNSTSSEPVTNNGEAHEAIYVAPSQQGAGEPRTVTPAPTMPDIPEFLRRAR